MILLNPRGIFVSWTYVFPIAIFYIDVIIKINKQTCQVSLITPISVIDTKIDKDDTNYLIFQVFIPFQTSDQPHEMDVTITALGVLYIVPVILCSVYIMMLIRYIQLDLLLPASYPLNIQSKNYGISECFGGKKICIHFCDNCLGSVSSELA